MSAEIDRLEINIEASASSAADKINSLADSLERIASSSSGIRDKLNNAADGFLNLKDSVKGMGDAVKSITKLNDALSNLSEITVPKGLKDLADVAKPLQSISDSIGNFSSTEDLQKTSVQLQALTQSLRSVSRVEIKNSDKLRDFVNNISSLQVDSENLANLKSLATAVSKITNAKVNEAAADSLRLFIDTVRILTDDDVVKLNALSDAASRLTKFKGVETPQVDENVSENIDRAGVSARNAMSFISGFDNALKKLAGGSAKAAGIAIKAVFSPLTTAASKFQNAAVKAGQFLSSIKRIAMYRAIRSAIRAITEGFTEGRKNLYYYSQAVGTDFAPSMDKAATAALYLKNSIGAATAPLTNYLVPMIDKAVDHVVDLINVFNELTATLTGAQTWTKALKYPTQWQDALDDTTKSAKKLKSTMLGFDELNIIEPISPAAKSAKFDMDDYAKMFTEMTTSQTWKNNLPEVVLPIKLAWDAQGDKTILTIKNTWKEILSLLGAVGESFRTVWTNGTGQKTLELLLEITQNIVGTFGNLAKNIKEAWKEGGKGTKIIQSVWNVANNLLTVFRDIWGSIREWAADLNWNPLLDSLGSLFDAIDKLTAPESGAMQILKGLFDKVLLPLGKFVIEDAVPAAFGVLADAVTGLNTALDLLEPALSWVADKLGKIAGFTFSNITGLTSGLSAIVAINSGGEASDQSALSLEKANEKIRKFFDFDKDGTTWYESLNETLQSFGEKGLWDFLNPDDGKIAEFGEKLYDYFSSDAESRIMFNLASFTATDSDIEEGWTELVSMYKDGIDQIGDAIGKVPDEWKNARKQLGEGWEKLKKNVSDFASSWTGFFESIGEKTYDTWENIKGWFGDNLSWEGLKGHVSNFAEVFSGKFGDMKTEVGTKFGEIKKTITDFFTDFGIFQKAAKFRDDVLDFFRGILGNGNSGVIRIFNDIKSSIVGAFDGIASAVKNPINSIIGMFEGMVNSVIHGLNWILEAIPSINFEIPGAKFIREHSSLDIPDTISFGASISAIKDVTLPRLANGGMINSGQLFLARESGAELVGQYGSGAAVMNNQQIVKAVSDGVYRAVTQAMAQSGNRETVVQSHIYLDRKELTAQVQQQEQSNGASIFGDVIYT